MSGWIIVYVDMENLFILLRRVLFTMRRIVKNTVVIVIAFLGGKCNFVRLNYWKSIFTLCLSLTVA